MPGIKCVFEVGRTEVATRETGGVLLVNYDADSLYFGNSIGHFDSPEKAYEAFEAAKKLAKINVTSISVLAYPLNVRWHRMMEYGLPRTYAVVRASDREVIESFPGTGKDARIFSSPNPWKEARREDWEHALGEAIAHNVRLWDQFPNEVG